MNDMNNTLYGKCDTDSDSDYSDNDTSTDDDKKD